MRRSVLHFQRQRQLTRVGPTPPAYLPSSRARLTSYDRARFPSDTLFDRIGRAVCKAGCLPCKELYESWELARRTRRLFRGGRVVDLGGGHGLLAHVMLLLDNSSPTAIVVDTALPDSARSVHDSIVRAWPRLSGRITFVSADMTSLALGADDVAVSSHGCGTLTDKVIEISVRARARVAVLPCCHDTNACDTGALEGWLDPAMAIDVMRATRLERHGYRVWTQTIPASITPKNRLLLGAPLPWPSPISTSPSAA